MRHRLGLTTRTQISVCKSPFLSAGTAVSLFRAKTVQQRPLLPREVTVHWQDSGTHTLLHNNLVIHGVSKKHELWQAVVSTSMD